MPSEAKARIKINQKLEKAGWRFFDDEHGKANIELESHQHLKILKDAKENIELNLTLLSRNRQLLEIQLKELEITRNQKLRIALEKYIIKKGIFPRSLLRGGFIYSHNYGYPICVSPFFDFLSGWKFTKMKIYAIVFLGEI